VLELLLLLLLLEMVVPLRPHPVSHSKISDLLPPPAQAAPALKQQRHAQLNSQAPLPLAQLLLPLVLPSLLKPQPLLLLSPLALPLVQQPWLHSQTPLPLTQLLLPLMLRVLLKPQPLPDPKSLALPLAQHLQLHSRLPLPLMQLLLPQPNPSLLKLQLLLNSNSPALPLMQQLLPLAQQPKLHLQFHSRLHLVLVQLPQKLVLTSHQLLRTVLLLPGGLAKELQATSLVPWIRKPRLQPTSRSGLEALKARQKAYRVSWSQG